MATNSKITYTLELDSTGAVRSINQTAKEFNALDSKVKSLTSSMKKQIEDAFKPPKSLSDPTAGMIKGLHESNKAFEQRKQVVLADTKALLDNIEATLKLNATTLASNKVQLESLKNINALTAANRALLISREAEVKLQKLVIEQEAALNTAKKKALELSNQTLNSNKEHIASLQAIASLTAGNRAAIVSKQA